jgi:hypothetical protein
VSYEPRKVVGRPKAIDPFERLARLNAFVRSIRPKDASKSDPLKDGSWPIRRIVGRPRPR